LGPFYLKRNFQIMEILNKVWPTLQKHKVKYLVYTVLYIPGIYWIAFIAGSAYALIESIFA